MGELCRSAAKSLTVFFKALTGEDLVPGIVAAIQTFGDRINFHPDLHLLVTEGGVDQAETFHRAPHWDDSRLARFRPTKIAIEADSNTPKIKQYQDYLAGKHEPGRDERDQIGFRLAKELNLTKINGIDIQGDFPFAAVQDYANAHGRVGEEYDYAGAGLLTD